MQFKHLESFVCVAEQGSFSKAALLMDTSPSLLTQHINILERDIQFLLFDRTYRGVSLTPAGKLFLDYARRLIALGSEAISTCRAAAGFENHHFTIGCYRESTYHLLQSDVERFASICPDVEISYQSHDYRHFFKLLEENAIDTFIHPFDNIIAEHHLLFQKLGQSRICCTVVDSHPLAAKEELFVEDLRGFSLILSEKAESRPLTPLFNYILANEPTIQIVCCSSDDEIFTKVFNKNHITLTFEYSDEPPVGCVSIPLDWPTLFDYGFVYRKDCSPALRRFLNFIRPD